MIALDLAPNSPTIGSPVYAANLYGDRRGYVAGISEYSGGTRYSIGAGGMTKESQIDLQIAFEDGTETTVSEGIAAPWLAKAITIGMEYETPERVAEMLATAKENERQRREEQRLEREKAAADLETYRNTYRDKIPADAKAVIIAQLEHDDSDVMNPPFAGRHYIKHIRHALRFLKPGGSLRAILPASAWYDHGELAELGGAWEDLPVASFAESGTNVPTGIFSVGVKI